MTFYSACGVKDSACCYPLFDEDNNQLPPEGEPVDPNATLRQIRALVTVYRNGGKWQEAEATDLVEAVEALDDWLTQGGLLPAAWAGTGSSHDKPIPITQYGTWTSRVTPYNMTLEQQVGDALDNWNVDEATLDAVCAAYREAINAALPGSVTLAGNEFYGPAFAEFVDYPTDEMGILDIAAIVDSIDFWAIAEPILDPPQPTPKLDELMARETPFAPETPTRVTVTARGREKVIVDKTDDGSVMLVLGPRGAVRSWISLPPKATAEVAAALNR